MAYGGRIEGLHSFGGCWVDSLYRMPRLVCTFLFTLFLLVDLNRGVNSMDWIQMSLLGLRTFANSASSSPLRHCRLLPFGPKGGNVKRMMVGIHIRYSHRVTIVVYRVTIVYYSLWCFNVKEMVK